MVDFSSLINAAFGDESQIVVYEDDIVQIFEQIPSGPQGSFTRAEAWNVFTSSFLTFSGHHAPGDDLGMVSGGWKVKVSNNVLKTSLVAASLTSILHLAGFTSLSGFVLPTVLPLLFDIEKIKLSKSEEYLLAELKLHPNLVSNPMSPQEMYHRLEGSLRQDISLLEFIDFMDKLHLSGDAAHTQGLYAINETSKLKITFY